MICEGKLISLQVETPPDSGVYKDLATVDCGGDEYKWRPTEFVIEADRMELVFPEMKSRKWQRRRFAQRLRMLFKGMERR